MKSMRGGHSTEGGTISETLDISDLVARSSDALSAEIDGEVVALDVAKGACYGLDPIGSRIWAMIENPTCIRDVCAALTASYEVDEVTCQRDVLDLFADLNAEGLIRVQRAAGPPVL